MSSTTLVRPAVPVGAEEQAVELAAARLADAVAEYDAALDEGVPMLILVRLDQEVAAATRHHHAVLAAVGGR